MVRAEVNVRFGRWEPNELVVRRLAAAWRAAGDNRAAVIFAAAADLLGAMVRRDPDARPVARVGKRWVKIWARPTATQASTGMPDPAVPVYCLAVPAGGTGLERVELYHLVRRPDRPDRGKFTQRHRDTEAQSGQKKNVFSVPLCLCG